jgi:hypothetical protein
MFIKQKLCLSAVTPARPVYAATHNNLPPWIDGCDLFVLETHHQWLVVTFLCWNSPPWIVIVGEPHHQEFVTIFFCC